MGYPLHRLSRLRKNERLRRMIGETRISIDDLIMPYFIITGKKAIEPIESMPGICRISIDNLIKETKEVEQLGIPAILLFGIPEKKDALGSQAYVKDGIVQRAVREVKKEIPALTIITDVCLCSYTVHGHCGIVKDGEIDNDSTIELLARTALSHAQAGADIVAPSAMMDGQVKTIRENLDNNGYRKTAIMSYSAKYASSFYGPFREAANSSPQFGDRKLYQMNPANSDEAISEIKLDVEEGADIVMVKPALAYLDIISRVRDEFTVPIAAYNVSGEYAMVKAASQRGWLEEKKIVLEMLTSIKRAGADIIITYWAKEVAKWLKS